MVPYMAPKLIWRDIDLGFLEIRIGRSLFFKENGPFLAKGAGTGKYFVYRSFAFLQNLRELRFCERFGMLGFQVEQKTFGGIKGRFAAYIALPFLSVRLKLMIEPSPLIGERYHRARSKCTDIRL